MISGGAGLPSSSFFSLRISRDENAATPSADISACYITSGFFVRSRKGFYAAARWDNI
jgi:hypothetical protein